uniref:Major facilitator superfamily associated domain-containing protein n=1 Tax=Timema bartmani TaxID=61472 RepID=A0A7R9I7F5_9NEOP|nr:unnamed protein product [Timema bartmani]
MFIIITTEWGPGCGKLQLDITLCLTIVEIGCFPALDTLREEYTTPKTARSPKTPTSVPSNGSSGPPTMREHGFGGGDVGGGITVNQPDVKTLYVLYPYLTIHMRELGINVEETAIMSAVTPIVAIVMPPLAGMVADRIGDFKILLSIFSSLGGGAALLLLLVPVGRITFTYPEKLIMDLSCQENSYLQLSLPDTLPCSHLNSFNEADTSILTDIILESFNLSKASYLPVPLVSTRDIYNNTASTPVALKPKFAWGITPESSSGKPLIFLGVHPLFLIEEYPKSSSGNTLKPSLMKTPRSSSENPPDLPQVPSRVLPGEINYLQPLCSERPILFSETKKSELGAQQLRL